MAMENSIHKVIINGLVITNYSDYSFIHRKTYEEEPVRTNGVIVNLNGYKTYSTPQLSFSFKYMPIEVYRQIMQLVNGSTNEFDVICYDIINDVELRAKMYFEPKEMANLLIQTKGQSLENQLTTLAVLDEAFNLIGTNADLGLIPITFNANGGAVVESPNGEGMYGEYFEMPSGDEFSRVGYLVDSYNTKADGTGISYMPNFIIQITHPLSLYVIWKSNTAYKLSFSYGAVSPPNDSENDPNWLRSKDVTYGQPIGALPSPVDPQNKYIFDGWYWVIPSGQPNLNDVRVNPSDNYPYNYNAICYGKWNKVEE